MRSMTVAVAFIALLVAVPAAAVDRIVDDNLVPCISVLPLHATIGAAVAAASPGETILVCPGNYVENVVVNTADLTIRGQGIVRLRPGDPGLDGFSVQANGVTIQGFDISGYTAACGVFVDASGADIRDNRVHDSSQGICIQSGTGHRIRYNITETNTNDGIVLSTAGGDVGNNTSKDNGKNGITAEACVGSVTIDHNHAIENHKIGIHALDCSGPTITHNTVRGTGYIGAGNSGGIVVELGQNALVKLNLVTDAVTGVLRSTVAALRGEQRHDDQVFIGGTSDMVAAFDAVGTVSEILRILEQQLVVVSLLEDVLDRGLSVAIGTETGNQALADCSLVVAPYVVDGETAGTIGVLGPTRMHYDQALSAVAVVANRLGRRLSEG